MAQAALKPDLAIGPYVFGRTLGIGSFGKVKYARHQEVGLDVAIKVLKKSKIKELEMDEKVRREIRILSMFTHPHIIRLYEVIDTPTDIFLVMEYVSKGELFDYIVQHGRLPEMQALRFFQQIVSGVEYCHFNMVCHRDLKPENLLFDKDLNIKIADFGLSNMLRDGLFLKTSCGSPNYAAPEVISGSFYGGPEVDIWSCGVILYALLCGSLPFDDENIPALFRKIRQGLYTLPGHLSQGPRDLIPKMLIVDPARRITLADIMKHPWFTQSLPLYLQAPPEVHDHQARAYDVDVVAEVAQCYNISAEVASEVVRTGVWKDKPKKFRKKDLRIAYDLLLSRTQGESRMMQLARARKLSMEGHLTFSPPLSQPGTPSSSPKAGSRVAMQRRMSRTVVPHRRWYLGIQSKKDPYIIMYEVFRALRAAGFRWRQLAPYTLICRWTPEDGIELAAKDVYARVFVGLQLYKVHTGIFLLDFQKIKGSPFAFMNLCASIINELKPPRSRSTVPPGVLYPRTAGPVPPQPPNATVKPPSPKMDT